MDKDIMVSISCITYNHASYIRDAIEGFLMQKTNFAYEILIHDDASTDGTADIIREYEKKYPDLIKPIYQTENQYSKGISVGNFNWQRAKGKYIAECEGDDYWTDSYKLQKQYDAMERHPEVDMCGHAVRRVRADDMQTIGVTAPSDCERILSIEEVILGPGHYLETNSLFYRSAILKMDYEFFRILEMDYSLKILGALRGGILYLPDCMSAYRVMAKGSWSATMPHGVNRLKWAETQKKKATMLSALDRETNYQYSEAISKGILHLEWFQLEIYQDYKGMLSPKYAEILAEKPRFHKAKLWVHAYLPWVIKIKERLKHDGKYEK